MKTNKWKKALSLILAFAMIFVLALPTAKAAGEENPTKKVTLHKLLLSEEDLKNWKSEDIEKNGYDASQDMSQLKAILTQMGKTAPVEIPGAYFAWQDADHLKDGDKDQYIKGKADNLKEPDLLNGALQYTTDVKEAMGGLTEATGIEFNTTKLPAGKYKIDEIYDKSTYVGAGGQTLTGHKAVPIDLTLPIINKTGPVANAHVYPKNTENKPDTTKTIEDTNRIIQGKTYGEGKKKKDVYGYSVGEQVPFKIDVTIPANAHYKTAYWTDQMTEGLTFVPNSLKVFLSDGTTEMNTKYYKLEVITQENQNKQGNGIKISLTSDGLKEINGKDKEVKFTIRYKALLNSAAVTAIPEANDIVFHYGNNPDHGNTPIPNHPKDGEMEVNKTWADAGDNELPAPENTVVKLTLYDAQTGLPVQKNGNDYSITLDGTGATPWKATFTGLENDREYYVKEEVIKGYSAEYSIDGPGKYTVKNWKDNNPEPIDPEEPRVENYGKKFVKTNDKQGTDLERLDGAQFIVLNKDKKYLAHKKGADSSDLAQKKTALDQAIEAYNKNTDSNQTKTLRDAVQAAQDAYNKAFIAAKTEYEWVTNETQAMVFFSNEDGQFEVTGLAPGTYYLKEKVAPKDYATLNGEIEFVVTKDSYTAHADGINYDKDDKNAKDAQRIENKKVLIPQTGGMGTVIFTVVGIAMVAGAFIILKKNKEDQYA